MLSIAPRCPVRVVFVAGLSFLIVLGVWSAAIGQSASGVDDEGFVRRLESAGADDPVDRTRLARLLFGVAATLEGGRSSVRLLGSTIRVRDPSRDSSRGAVDARYADYSRALDAFGSSTSQLLDRPMSGSALFRTLSDGHRSCWQLDAFTRTVKAYGVRNQDLMSILSSIEACSRFRRVAYVPVVERIVSRDLEESDRLRDEVRALKRELAELERLLEDLRRIDSGE